MFVHSLTNPAYNFVVQLWDTSYAIAVILSFDLYVKSSITM